jgi:hypothetical protein
LHDAATFRRRVQAVHTRIVDVALTANESRRFQGLHDARYRRRANVLGSRELAERPRAAEDEHRESGQLRGRHTRGWILAADVPQRVDRGRVEAVRRVD